MKFDDEVRQRAFDEGGIDPRKFDGATLYWAAVSKWYALKLDYERARVEGGDAIRRGMQQKIDALASRLEHCESELRGARMTLGAIVASNGGELYLRQGALEKINPADSIERNDLPTGGVMFVLRRVVERHAQVNPERACYDPECNEPHASGFKSVHPGDPLSTCLKCGQFKAFGHECE